MQGHESCNESTDKNELNRQFNQEEAYRVVIGFSSGPNKDAALVYRTISSIKINWDQVKMFNTDRGNEFKNKLIDEALEALAQAKKRLLDLEKRRT